MLNRLTVRIERFLRRNLETMQSDYMQISPQSAKVLHPTPLRIALLGTCMTDKLSRAFDALGDDTHTYVLSTPHDRVPDAAWETYEAAIVMFNLRELLGDDLSHTRITDDASYAALESRAQSNLKIIIRSVTEAIAGRTPVFFMSLVEPPNSYQGVLLNNRRRSLFSIVSSLNTAMATMLEADAACHYLEINDLMSYFGSRQLSDGYFNHFTHAGFKGRLSKVFHEAIVVRIWQALTILRSDRQIKLIVTDLDNTLWKGVLAEMDEIEYSRHIDGWPLGYVEALLEFKRRGGLLAICSKNDHDETVNRFARLWGESLLITDFCSVKIGWQPKSDGIREILAETNLLPANVLFIDDNPREIEEVRSAFPEIRTLSGDEKMWRSYILYSPFTQVARISAESASRTELMAAKTRRDVEALNTSRDDYLRGLKLRLAFHLIRERSDRLYPRAVELLNKTNQFNTTGKRWSDAEIATLLAHSGFMIGLSARDKFGENGLVAVAIIRERTIEQIVLSCRMFGLGVETALLSYIGRMQLAQQALLIDTGRNKGCASFYRDHGMSERDGKWVAADFPETPPWIAIETR